MSGNKRRRLTVVTNARDLDIVSIERFDEFIEAASLAQRLRELLRVRTEGWPDKDRVSVWVEVRQEFHVENTEPAIVTVIVCAGEPDAKHPVLEILAKANYCLPDNSFDVMTSRELKREIVDYVRRTWGRP